MGRLTDAFVRSAPVGKHEDDDGLRLVVRETAKAKEFSKTWVFRFQVGGRRREMSVGVYPVTGIKDARKAAHEARSLIAAGVDPIDARRSARLKEKPLPTFGAIAADMVDAHEARGGSKKSLDALKRYLGPSYVGPWLDRPVTEITSLDVLKLITPLRRDKPEACRKFYPILRKTFARARIVLRDGHGVAFANPADADDLEAAGYMAPDRLTRGHHPALPWRQLPEFMRELRALGTLNALAAELAILTLARTGAVLKADAKEFDLDAAVWTVPRKNLKDAKHRGEDFRIPLCPRAVEIVKLLPRKGPLFPSDDGETYRTHFLLVALRQLGRDRWVDPQQGNKPITIHGTSRATFRTWASDMREDRDLVETAMGHVVGSVSERAYDRSDLFAHRRALMDRWCRFAMGECP